MPFTPKYPTSAHEQAATAIVAFFAAREETDTVLLVNSCARGKATRDSCLDVQVLVPEGTDAAALEAVWQRRYETDPPFAALRGVGAFSVVHLDISDGTLDPVPHPDDEYPDDFELRIGNARSSTPSPSGSVATAWPAYGVGGSPTTMRGGGRNGWRPSAGAVSTPSSTFRPTWSARLYFQAFARLWGAFQMFLQALFIARRTYPIAYDKWIHEQVVEILGLPELYERLPHLFEIGRFESAELVDKAQDLQRLLDAYVDA